MKNLDTGTCIQNHCECVQLQIHDRHVVLTVQIP